MFIIIFFTMICACRRIATHGFEGYNPECCGVHAQPKMVKLATKHCWSHKCKELPTHDKESVIYPRYCIKHKEAGMVDISEKVCTVEDCINYATFGITKATHCINHKIKDQKRTGLKYCKVMSCFGLIDQTSHDCILQSACIQHVRLPPLQSKPITFIPNKSETYKPKRSQYML